MIVIANESRMSERGLHSGPQSGAYFPISITTGATMTTDVSHLWKAPFPCRVVHTSADCASTVGGQYSIASTTGDIVALRTIPTAVEEFAPGGSLDLNAVASANRSLAIGDVLTVLLDVGTNIVGVTVVVTLYSQGHPTAWDADND